VAKRSDTVETVVLALELLRRIPRDRLVTAAQLHAQLKDAGMERDLRTIQRQLEMLSLHFGVERDDRSKPYGYRWRDKAPGLSMPGLSAHEALLMRLAEENLKALLPSRLSRSLEPFFSQARRVLSLDARAVLERQWTRKVRVVSTTQPLLAPGIASGVFEAVSNALYRNHWLRVDYRNADGRRSRIDVMPLGLVQQGSRLYLVCRYAGYEDERNLALHRMTSAAASDLPFERPNDFSLARYEEEGRLGFGSGRKVRLHFRIASGAGQHLRETPLAHDQEIVELKDGWLDVSATVFDSEVLDKWLRGFGSEVHSVRKEPVN
jgi:predicted DNA-binding transcriptional regulator YafY